VTLPVTITVKDTNGAVQSGLHLYAFNASTYTGYSAMSDSNGTAVFALPQGSYRFRADLNGTQFWSNAQNDCTIPGCTSDVITVTLPVTITVTNTDGTAQTGLPVYAFAGTTYTGYKSTTDSNGQVSLTLPQGSYRFRADLNGTQFWSSATDTCTLPGCATASITVTKPLILTVQGQSGQPYPNLPVYAFNGTTYTGYHGTTDTNGHATFILPEGSYRFRADLNGTPFWSGTQNDCTVPGCATATVTLPSSMAQQTVTINYTYDALNRLTAATYSDPNDPGAGGNAFAYAYDAAGNVLQYTQTTGTLTVTTTYTYDSANQLATAQLGNASAVNYTYDGDGNLLTNGVNHYAYDSADRLISVTSASGTVTMAYDGLGDRLSMSAAGVTTQYVIDPLAGTGNGQVLEATSGGKTTAYLYGVGPVGQMTDSWAYDLPDGTNTPRQLVSSQGQITFSARYTPWGDTLQSSGTGNFTYGYLGGLMDTSTGLLYMGSGQYYDPQTGRFLSRNAKPDQTNPYVPWGGNPTGALFTPLALLFMFYSRRKKRGTLDMIIILVVLGVSLSMSLTACGSNNGPTTTIVNTPTGPATVTVTPTPTGATVAITAPPPAGSPVGTPSTTCTITLTSNNLYNQAVHLLGFVPINLDQWSDAELTELINWLNHGIIFESRPMDPRNIFTADDLKEVIRALDYAKDYLGSKFDEALGLSGGGNLTFERDSTEHCTEPSCEGGYSWQASHVIQLWLLPDFNLFATFTALHEIGHFVSYYLSPGHLSYSKDWINATGWENDNGTWVLPLPQQGGIVRQNSTKTPAEDFADTFAWMVEDKVGDRGYVENTFNSPSSSRQNYFEERIAG
jgi:RHS repeat-associated protein